MSGHSKWSSIKHQKAATDAKRSGVFTKLANGITVAARNGADPTMNFQLRLAIDRAKAANMPKANIDRAIARGTGAGAGEISENVYEAYGPSGAAIIIEVATDNKNRAASEIKAALNKFGGKLAGAGAVQYLFEKKGQITLKPGEKSEDETEMDIIDSGAQDYETSDNEYLVSTAMNDLESVKKNIEEKGYEITDAKLIWEPNQQLSLDEESSQKVIKLLTALDDLDDVTGVASNIG